MPTHFIRLLSLLVLVLGLAAFARPSLQAGPVEGQWYTFSPENGLAGSVVQSMWQAPSGEIWFGTEQGISRYNGHEWQSYRVTDGLLNNNVWAISGDDEAVWCATSSGISVFQEGAWRNYSVEDGLPSNDVRTVLVASDGTVWAGTFGQGIAYLRPNTSRWQRFDVSSVIDRPGLFVQHIWQEKDGALWFSTNSIGALRLDNDELERFSFRVVNHNTVWSVGAGSDDSIWFATLRGIIRYDKQGSFEVIRDRVADIAIDETEVLAVSSDQRGTLWLGTRAHGVLRRDQNGWQQIAPELLGGTYVQTILVDQEGRVWFGTRGGGVTLFEPRAQALEALQAKAYTVNIQNQSSQVLGDQPHKQSNNNLQFQFELDLAWVPPQAVSFSYRLEQPQMRFEPTRRLRRSPNGSRTLSESYIDLPPGDYVLHVVPQVGSLIGREQRFPFKISSAPPAFGLDRLTVTADGTAVERGLVLSSALFGGERAVELAFAAHDDATPDDQLRYRYRLSPEANWQYALGSNTTIELAQGSYEIEVEAIDGDGNHSEPLIVSLIVPAPLWKTFLFYALLVLIPSALGGVGGAFAYRRWARHQALLRAVSGYLIPYDVGPLITAPDRYIGRQHVIDTVLGKLANNSFYIYGEKRIGKTSLLLQLKQRIIQRNSLDQERIYLPVFRNIQDLPQERFWFYLMRSVAAEFEHGELGLLIDNDALIEYDDLDAESDLQSLVDYVHAHDGRQAFVVLLLDEVDTLQNYGPAVLQRFRAFCQHMQGCLRVVLTGVLPPGDDHTDTSPWYNIFDRITLGPLAQADVLQIIRSYNDNPYSYMPEAETAILELSDNKPFETQWLCSEAVKAMLNAQRSTVELSDVEHAAQVLVRERSSEYNRVWQALSPEQRNLLQSQPDSVQLARKEMAALWTAGVLIWDTSSDKLQHIRLTRLFHAWIANHHYE